MSGVIREAAGIATRPFLWRCYPRILQVRGFFPLTDDEPHNTPCGSRSSRGCYTKPGLTAGSLINQMRKEYFMTEAKNIDQFIEEQQASLKQNPECGNTHYNLGVALLSQRKTAEAENAFFAAIENSPGLAEAYVQLGAICLQRGDLDGCLDFNTRAVKARPGFSEGYGNIGFVHFQKGNLDEAIVALERATAFNFRFLQGLTTLANAYLMKGRVADSIHTNLKALAIEPRFAVAHNNLAIAYLEQGDTAKAIAHYDKAVEFGYEVAPQIRTEIETLRSAENK